MAKDLVQEVLGAGLLRVAEDLLRSALLHHVTVGHEDHPVGHLAGEAHLVRDHDHRHATLREVAQNLQHLAHHLGVQGAGRLVEQHDVRVHRQGPRDRDALLLPTGQVRRLRVRLLRQPDLLEQPDRRRPRLLLGGPLGLHGREHHVLDRRHMREQVEVLEDHADVLTHPVDVDLLVAHVEPVDHDLAVRDVLEPVEAAQERALAGARRPDHADHFTARDVDVEALEDLVVAERLLQTLHPDLRVGGLGLVLCHRCLGHLLILFSSRFDSFVNAMMMMKYITPMISHMLKDWKLRAMMIRPV